jgi:hypothetical protein
MTASSLDHPADTAAQPAVQQSLVKMFIDVIPPEGGGILLCIERTQDVAEQVSCDADVCECCVGHLTTHPDFEKVVHGLGYSVVRFADLASFNIFIVWYTARIHGGANAQTH